MACSPLPAVSNDAVPFSEPNLIAEGARLAHHKQTNRVNSLGSPAGQTLSIPGAGPSRSAAESAIAALDAYGTLFGLSAPPLRDGPDQTHRRGERPFRRPLPADLPGHPGDRRRAERPPRLNVSTTETITAQQAAETALGAVAKWHRTTASALAVSAPMLSVYDPQLLGPGTAPASLVWRMEVTSTELKPIRELVLVDAQRGHISLHFNQVDTVRNRETYTSGETAALPPDPGAILVCDEIDPNCDAGSPIISSVHWTDGVSCPNAYWDGSQMVYCSGLVADDVVAHELTHGVTQNTSNLFYYYQSGAINESLSDLWGSSSTSATAKVTTIPAYAGSSARMPPLLAALAAACRTRPFTATRTK